MQDTQRPISKECPVCGESFEPDEVGSRCPIDGSLLLVRSDHPLIGQVVAERYRVVEMVGTGGWSFVFRAEHVSLSRTYAVKVLHAHLSNVGDNLRRFQHEAEAASRLTHPNIASVYDYGLLNNGQPYLVMDYLEGRSLHDLLHAQGGKLPWSRASGIFLQCCDALAFAHEKGLIHRDIKPANIMIVDTTGGDQVKVLDFGLAKFIAETRDASLTATGQTIGTPSYMSPEQCLGKQLDQRSDIYSLGCVMYETLSGANPFSAGSYLESMNLHLAHTPRSLSAAGSSPSTIPPRVAMLIERAMSRQEEHRQRSMLQLRQEILDSERQLDSASALLETCKHRLRKVLSGPPWLGMALISASLLVAGSFAFWQWQSTVKPLNTVAPEAMDAAGVDFQEAEFGKRLVLSTDRPAAAQLKEAREPETYMGVTCAGTDLTDADLPALLPFCNAKEIDLSFTAVTDKGLPTLQKFPVLSKLVLQGDEGVTDSCIDSLATFPQLRRLNLSLTHLTAGGVKQLAKMKRLRKLHLKMLPVDDEALAALTPLRQLELLDVERTQITDKSMGVIAGFPMMLLLNARHTRVTDDGIAELTRLPNLLVLQLEGSQLTSGCAASLRQMPRLRTLELSDTKFDDGGLFQLAGMPYLACLNLSSSRVTSAGVARFRAENPKVKIDYIEAK